MDLLVQQLLQKGAAETSRSLRAPHSAACARAFHAWLCGEATSGTGALLVLVPEGPHRGVREALGAG